ncbi:MAG: hypothetical protein HFH27_04880 [Clostridiaceae bacterium]|nr:hypothetical protein [Clostridiaceae bacterium]MCI9483774.1 hypothetical protein [Clostridiaceae bacterium]
MPTESERKDIRKSMAYDLLRIIHENPEKSYTAEELEQLIHTYLDS